MAGYLCARLYAPRPRFVLSPIHNGRQILDPNMTWSDFMDYVYYFDNDHDNNQNNNGNTVKRNQKRTTTFHPFQSPLVDWFHPTNPLDVPHVFTVHLQHPTYPYFLSDDRAKITRHFEQVETYVWNTQQPQYQQQQEEISTTHHNHNNSTLPFIWEITTEFYQWHASLQSLFQARKKKQLEEEQGDGVSDVSLSSSNITSKRDWRSLPPFCTYAEKKTPRHLFKIRDVAKKRIQALTRSSSSAAALRLMGALHVRRNDATKECDTSLPRLESYLNCSLWETISTMLVTGSRTTTTTSTTTTTTSEANAQVQPPQEERQQEPWQVTILFSSDERNQTYRQEVGRILQNVLHQVVVATDESLRTSPSSTSVPLQQHYDVNITMIDLDQLINQILEEQIQQGRIPAWRRNNFYAFQVMAETQKALPIRFHLEQRRSFQCPACTNVKQQLVQAGVLR